MPDVPQQPQDILCAARERATIVAGHLDVLGADLAVPRPAVLGDADREAGVAAFTGAAAALRDLAAVIGRDDAVGSSAAGTNDEGGEDVEHA